jgi:CRP/FNR family transcriptional regulator, anaerobic regulatory protein
MLTTAGKQPSGMRSVLLRGRDQLEAKFPGTPACFVRAGETLAAFEGSRDRVFRLQSGWACYHRDLTDGRRAIIDVYLPGDLIGLDALFGTRPMENVLALTSIEIKTIDADNALEDLLASNCTALYVAFLLGWRQRRTDRLLTAIACLDARGRLATMVLDFYRRLRARKLIAGRTYTLPLTQQHIGEYLGLTVVHVNRVLRSLRNERIAHLEKNCVTILDLERLRRLAREPDHRQTTVDPVSVQEHIPQLVAAASGF